MPFAPCLLGTHVGRCPSEPRPLAEVLVSERQPKVGNEGFARSVDQDVGGLDVPVDQTSGMGVMKGFGDRCHQCRRLVEAGACLP